MRVGRLVWGFLYILMMRRWRVCWMASLSMFYRFTPRLNERQTSLHGLGCLSGCLSLSQPGLIYLQPVLRG